MDLRLPAQHALVTTQTSVRLMVVMTTIITTAVQKSAREIRFKKELQRPKKIAPKMLKLLVAV